MKDLVIGAAVVVLIIVGLFFLFSFGLDSAEKDCKERFGQDYIYVYGNKSPSFCHNNETGEDKYL